MKSPVLAVQILLPQPIYIKRGIKMEKTKRERGPNTRELQYSISLLMAAMEVLREKAGMEQDAFEKLVDIKFDEMYPKEAKKEEVVV